MVPIISCFKLFQFDRLQYVSPGLREVTIFYQMCTSRRGIVYDPNLSFWEIIFLLEPLCSDIMIKIASSSAICCLKVQFSPVLPLIYNVPTYWGTLWVSPRNPGETLPWTLRNKFGRNFMDPPPRFSPRVHLWLNFT